MFKVFGDEEIWKIQLMTLKKILPNLTISCKKEMPKEVETETETDLDNEDNTIDFGSLPQMDLSDIPDEFKEISQHFEALRRKYVFKT
jgi:hypothetical protein